MANTSNKGDQKINGNNPKKGRLRQKAEELLKINEPARDKNNSEAGKLTLIHALEVHQVELEMQNEALTQANEEIKKAIEKYTELYDYAPFGYVTLSGDGKIIELNISGCQMLGNERSKLQNKLFAFFVSDDTKPIFHLFLKKLFTAKTKESCEVILLGINNLAIHVNLTGRLTVNGKHCLITMVDITGRNLVKEEILKSEQHYQILAEVAPVGIFHTNVSGYTTYVNPSWCLISGLSYEEAMGNNWLKAVHEDDKKEIAKGWREAVKKRGSSISEYRFIHGDGTIAWVMGQAIPQKNAEDEILGYVGTITDITARKQMEEKLKESERFLKETQIIANLGTYSFDIRTGKWTSSEVMDSILGIDASFDRNYENWVKIVHPDWQGSMNHYFTEEVLGRKLKFDKEYKIVRVNDKEVRWIHGIGNVKWNDKNEPITMVGTLHDITARKLVENELIVAREKAEESTSKFRNYVENAPDGIFVSDERGNYVEVNPAATLITGYSREELLTMSIKDLTPPDSLEAAFTHFNHLFKTGVSKNDIKFMHKSGAIRWYSVEAVTLSENRFLGFVKDITDRKKSEEEIKKSNERFELIAKATNDGLWDWDLETNVVWANETHQRLYGLTLADPVPDYKEWIQRIHPEDRARTVMAFETVRNSKQKSLYEEYRFNSDSNGWIHVYGRTLVEHNKEGKAVRLIGSMIDITELKKTEEALLVSKKQFQNLVENISGVYWVNNLDTYETIYISPSYETIWGRKMEDLYKNPADFINAVHPDDRPALIEAHNNIAQSTVMNIFYRIIRPGGETRWISAKIYVVINDDGNRVEYGYAEDITERKNAEIALVNAEKRLQFLLSATPAVIYSSMVEFPYSTTFISENITEQTGYAPEEFSNDPNFWAENIHPDDKAKVMEDNNYIFEEGHYTFEYRFRVKNGSYLWIHDECRLIFDSNGVPVEMVGYWLNIDERKRAEEAIKISEEKYRQLFERSPLPMWVYDIDSFSILDVNEAAILHYGYSKEEFTGMKITNLRPAEEVAKFLSVARKQKKGLQNFGLWKHRKKDGALIDVEISSHDIDFSNKSCRLVLSNDVTEKLKMELALAESENRLRSIYNTEPECIKLLNYQGELVDMNPAGLSMIEADSLSQVQNAPVFGLLKTPYRKDFKKLIKNVFQGNSEKLEFEITGLKGTTRWLDTHAIPLKDAEGKIILMLGVTRDITENKKTREAIKHTTEQLRQLTSHLQIIREEERKRIGREIHDELGQQLTAIKMDVVWIEKKIPAEAVAIKNKLGNVIGLLDGSNQSVRRIINELRPAILDDHGLLEAMEWVATQFTGNTGIPVKFTCAEQEIRTAPDIATCIFRVYQEAFTNIARHAGATNVNTSLKISGDHIVVIINDDGKGFTIESIQNNRSFGILGMKERVISLNGDFGLISSPGKGTTITMTLPYANIIT